MTGPLAGIKIIDFTRLIPGPFCSKILSDLGAEVIKIEDMGKGDYINFFPPQALGGDSLHAVYFHKNKKRLKIDFKSPGGREAVCKLVRGCDVLIESYRPGVMKAWGLDFRHIKAINKKIIYASITGFGQKGKSRDRAGHDMNFLAESGILAELLSQDSKPQPPAYQLADYVGGGLFAALQICAALAAKRCQARHLDISMTAAMSYLCGSSYFGENPPDMHAVTGTMARYQIYATRDKRLFCLAALEDKFWERFCLAVNHPEWMACGFDKERNAAVMQELAALVASKDAAHWLKFSESNDVCASLVFKREDLVRSGALEKVKLTCKGEVGAYYESATLVRQSNQKYARAGDDNISILKKLGYSPAKIKNLKAAGIIP